MSIDTSGKYWTGTGPEDIDEYLRALTADGYRVDRTVHAKCTCGTDVFALLADADEGAGHDVAFEHGIRAPVRFVSAGFRKTRVIP